MAKRKITPVNTDDITKNNDLVIETKLKASNMGRPKKFKKEMTKKINLLFSEGQLNAVDDKMKELGITVRLDYFRKLLREDIKDFDLL